MLLIKLWYASKPMRWLLALAFSAVLVTGLPGKSEATDHPRLLSTRAGWAAMIASSTIRPWSDIKAGATTYYASPLGVNYTDGAYYMSNLGNASNEFKQQQQNRYATGLGVLTLLYVLNSNNSGSITYRNKILGLMDVWPAMWNDNNPYSEANAYYHHVPMNASIFNMTLALDNIHDDLTAVQRSSYNVMIDSWVAVNRTRSSSWALNNHGTYMAYSLYRDTDSYQIATDTTCYKVLLMGNDSIYPPAICGARESYRGLSSEISPGSQLNVDGISGSGSSYAWERLGGGSREKIGKWGGVHVAVFTGIDTSYLTEPKMANFYEWLFAGHTNPWNAKTVYSDTANNQLVGLDFFQSLSTIYGNNLYLLKNAYFAAGIYSDRARQYANRSIEVARATATVVYPFEFIDYATVRSTITTAQAVQSTAIKYGGAAFWEQNTSSAALMGKLVNYHITKNDHYHAADWNGLYLVGYGETFLSNCGVGSGTSDGIMGFPWWFHHDDAHSGNTVLIANKNFAQDRNVANQYSNSFADWNPLTTGQPPGIYVGNTFNTPLYGGDGVLESVLSNKFDYAMGLATSPYVYRSTVTGDITHDYGQNERNFMFIHPEDGANGYWITVDEVRTSSMPTVNVLWHPYGTYFTTNTVNQQYTWPIMNRSAGSTATLSVFMATPPTVVTSSHSPFSASPGSFVGAYINAEYAVDVASIARVATILYPTDFTHAIATFTRLADTGVSGASIESNGVVDRIFTSSPSVTVSTGGVSYTGRIGWFRTVSAAITQWFVKQGRSFSDGAATPYGFTSDAPISIHMNGSAGTMTSTGTAVTFYYPGLQTVNVDGVLASGVDGVNAYTITVSSGSHDISFSVGSSEVASSSASFSLLGGITIKGAATLK